MWPADDAELERAQDALGVATPPPWRPHGEPLVGGCFVCFGRGVGGPGARGEPGWAAAALGRAGGAVTVVRGTAGAPDRGGRPPPPGGARPAPARGPPPPRPARPPPRPPRR